MFVWTGEKDHKHEYVLFSHCEMHWVKVKNTLNMYKLTKLHVKWFTIENSLKLDSIFESKRYIKINN